MTRRILLGAALAVAAALALYGWLTAVPAGSALGASARAPDPANGLTVFNAGGCSSCHAVPGQPDRLRPRGGGGRLAVRDVLCAEHLAGPGRWHRAMDRGRIRGCGDEGDFAGRVSLLP